MIKLVIKTDITRLTRLSESQTKKLIRNAKQNLISQDFIGTLINELEKFL